MCCSFCVDVPRTVAYGFLSPHDPVNSGSPTVLDILMYFTLRGRRRGAGVVDLRVRGRRDFSRFDPRSRGGPTLSLRHYIQDTRPHPRMRTPYISPHRSYSTCTCAPQVRRSRETIRDALCLIKRLSALSHSTARARPRRDLALAPPRPHLPLYPPQADALAQLPRPTYR